jgi:hypothetical protein
MNTPAYTMISSYNSSPMYFSENTSMLNSIRQEYQHPSSSLNNNPYKNVRSNLPTANNHNTNTNQQLYINSAQQVPPRKTASYYMCKPVS